MAHAPGNIRRSAITRSVGPLQYAGSMTLVLALSGCMSWFPPFGADQRQGAAQSAGPAPTESFPLADLPAPLGQVANAVELEVRQTSAVQADWRAAAATRRATGYDRLPTIVPSASVALTDGGSAQLGLEVEQSVYDFGRVQARVDAADVAVDQARAQAWLEVNQRVFDGLTDYVEMSRQTERLAALSELERQLVELETLLADRVASGAAARGETLKVAVALQEVRRESIDGGSKLDVARARLQSKMPSAQIPPPLPDLVAARTVCVKPQGGGVSPAMLAARLGIREAESEEAAVKSRRFPRLVLGTGVGDTVNIFPSVGLRLDAAGLLGLGRRENLAAARAGTEAAAKRFERAETAFATDMAQLETERSGLIRREEELLRLLVSHRETLQVFDDQVSAGTVELVDGIALYREEANTWLAIVDARSAILTNCLDSARQRGTLAPYLEDFGTEGG